MSIGTFFLAGRCFYRENGPGGPYIKNDVCLCKPPISAHARARELWATGQKRKAQGSSSFIKT